MTKNLPAMRETWVRSLDQEDPLQNGYPLQYTFRENPMDRGAWCTTVHEVTKSQARLITNTFTFFFGNQITRFGQP